MKPEQERLAEAIAVERVHGDHANEHVNERVNALAEAGDMAGMKRWTEIGEWLERLRRPGGPAN